eukprot:6129664-Pyramimonas_sp.AAC.1
MKIYCARKLVHSYRSDHRREEDTAREGPRLRKSAALSSPVHSPLLTLFGLGRERGTFPQPGSFSSRVLRRGGNPREASEARKDLAEELRDTGTAQYFRQAGRMT